MRHKIACFPVGFTLMAAALIIACHTIAHPISASNVAVPIAVANWPSFEDAYFNIKFQYPPEWRVEKVDVTNYDEESHLSLMGEDAATAGPDKYKTWILRILPPYDDIQRIHEGALGIVPSAIVINLPNQTYGGSVLSSDVSRPNDRAYESALDKYDEGFRFVFTSVAGFNSPEGSTSVSLGHTGDGSIAGIIAVKRLHNDYQFQAYMTMTTGLGHNEDNMLAFLSVLNTIQLRDPTEHFDAGSYKLPVSSSEYRHSHK
jgi:hypothetical protein